MRPPALMGVLREKGGLLFWIPWLGASPKVISLGPEDCLGPLLGGCEGLLSLPPCASHPFRLVGAECAGAQHRLGRAHAGAPLMWSAGQNGSAWTSPTFFLLPLPLTVVYGSGGPGEPALVLCIYCAFSRYCLGVGGGDFSLKRGIRLWLP